MRPDELIHPFTLWTRNADGSFAAGVLRDGLWISRVKSKANTVKDISSGPTFSLFLGDPVDIGDMVALGDRTGDIPQDVASVHEVKEYKEIASTPVVRKATIQAVYGQLWKAVRVYPVTATASARGTSAQRGAILYEGPGEVQTAGAPSPTQDVGAPAQETRVTVTIPSSVDLSTAFRYEVEWTSPNGVVVIDATLSIIGQYVTPFLHEMTGVVKVPEV